MKCQIIARDCVSSGELLMSKFCAFELFFFVVLLSISFISKCAGAAPAISGSTDFVSMRLAVTSLQSTCRTVS